MIRLVLLQAWCAARGGHPWGDWSPWTDDGSGGQWRQKFCARCPKGGFFHGI